MTILEAVRAGRAADVATWVLGGPGPGRSHEPRPGSTGLGQTD